MTFSQPTRWLRPWGFPGHLVAKLCPQICRGMRGVPPHIAGGFHLQAAGESRGMLWNTARLRVRACGGVPRWIDWLVAPGASRWAGGVLGCTTIRAHVHRAGKSFAEEQLE